MSEFRVFFPAAAAAARYYRTVISGSAGGGVPSAVAAAVDREDKDSEKRNCNSTSVTASTTGSSSSSPLLPILHHPDVTAASIMTSSPTLLTTATASTINSPPLTFVSASVNDTNDGVEGVARTRTVTQTTIYSTITTTTSTTTHTLVGSESTIHQRKKHDADITAYSNDLKAFVTSLNVHMHGPDRWERRCDRYLVGPPHVGIKFRGGGGGGGGALSASTASTKLEMKIRKKRQAACIEKWKKSVLAKSDSPTALADCIPDIISTLKENSIYDGTEEAFFHNPVYIEVEKSRTALTCEMDSSGFIVQEFCILSVPILNPLLSGGVENEIWYSLCVEGDKDHIQKFLKSSSYIRELVDLLTKVKMSWEDGDDDDDFSPIIPVIGGYPSWVRFLGTRDIIASKADFVSSLVELSSHVSKK